MHSHKYENYSLIVLFFSLLSILLIYPFLKTYPGSDIVLKSLLSFVLIAAVAATTHKISSLIIASLLAIATLLSNWGTLFDDTQVWVTVNLQKPFPILRRSLDSFI